MITINNVAFDVKKGEILKPQKDAIPFRSQFRPGIGVQVTSLRGPGFTLTLTRYILKAEIETFRDFIHNLSGTVVQVVDRYDDIVVDYSFLGIQFAVTQSRVIETKMVPFWAGYRLGVKREYRPAIRTMSQITMYGVTN